MIAADDRQEEKNEAVNTRFQSMISFPFAKEKEGNRKWVPGGPWNVFMDRFKEGSKPLRVFQCTAPPPTSQGIGD